MDELKLSILLTFIGVLANANVITVPLANYHDVIYRGKISVGSPLQTFEAVYHTGCTLTRFPRAKCEASGRFANACNNNQTYNPADSYTSRPSMGFVVDDVEYTHFGASGVRFKDTLTFGSPNSQLKLYSATVGASEKVWGFDHSVVCLAYQTPYMTDSTFVEMHKNRVLSKSLMTVALRKCDRGECEDGGAVTFGGLDKQRCHSKVHWTDVIRGSFMWRFRLNNFAVNRNRISAASEVIANTDTGNSYIHIPKDLMPVVVKELNAQKQGNYYTVDCNAKFTLNFMINRKVFTVNEKHLILNQQINEKCVVAITENSYKQRMFILGAAFHRAVCVVHDLASHMLGFAQSTQF
ncbi:Asp-domain-containing protein [Aphelenchoides besseyi]|nr:Asp-domain-containing protein [Aphelenchoides besseyi]KAI6200446.1 Asp-domain-containing protein [Aphelenchoides besseyi]